MFLSTTDGCAFLIPHRSDSDTESRAYQICTTTIRSHDCFGSREGHPPFPAGGPHRRRRGSARVPRRRGSPRSPTADPRDRLYTDAPLWGGSTEAMSWCCTFRYSDPLVRDHPCSTSTT